MDAFRNARPSILELARKDTVGFAESGDDDHTLEQPAAKRRRRADVGQSESASEETAGDYSEGRRTRLRSARVDSQRQSKAVATEVIEDSQDEDFVPSKRFNLLPFNLLLVLFLIVPSLR